MSATAEKTENRKYEILTGLVVLGITFGGFLLGELGLRVMQYARFGTQASVEKTSDFYVDETTGLRLIKPDRQLGRIRINNLGFRGPDIAIEKQPKSIRLLFLGSSTTYDAASTETENWPAKTVNSLKESYPACTFEYINAGQPGFSTRSMLQLYQSKLDRLQSDIVVILPGDINSDLDWLAAAQGFDTTHYRQSWLSQKSVLWAKLEKNLVIIERQRDAFSRAGKAVLDEPAITNRFASRLKALTTAINKDKSDVIVNMIGSQLRAGQSREKQVQTGNTNIFFMPHFALQDILKTRLAFNEVIEEMSGPYEYDIVDPALHVPADGFHYQDSAHFTPAGSAIMAQHMAEQLADSDALKKKMKGLQCS